MTSIAMAINEADNGFVADGVAFVVLAIMVVALIWWLGMKS